MFGFLRSALVAALLFLFLPFAVLGDDTNASAIPAELAAADQFYRAGKFAEAEAAYIRGFLRMTRSSCQRKWCLLKLDWCGLCCGSRKLMKRWTQ
jgi:hypothetical protein